MDEDHLPRTARELPARPGRGSRRLGAVLVAGTVVLGACGGQPDAAAPAAVSEAAATDSAGTTPDELADALLPAPAFGADATVVGLTLDQLGDLPALGGLPDGATVDPPLCGAALAMLPGGGGSGAGSADGLPTLVARGAFTDELRTLEVLADGPALDGLELPVDQLLGTCSTVTLTAADGTATTASLSALDVPALGDAGTGLTVTVSGPQGTLEVLVGVVSAGTRAVLLVQTGAAGAAPDAAGFTALLADAADAATE